MAYRGQNKLLGFLVGISKSPQQLKKKTIYAKATFKQAVKVSALWGLPSRRNLRNMGPISAMTR